MDSRVKALKDFFSGIQTEKLKLESRRYGFDFLDEILAGGVTLEYGQLVDGLIHKYKLLNVSKPRFDALLEGHVAGDYNVCCYFRENANNICCFNIDNNFKDFVYNDPATTIPEIKSVVATLISLLQELGLTPLALLSGRGYHLWLRFEATIANRELYDFLNHAAAKALMVLHDSGYDHRKIKIAVYPNPQIINTGSLRLFGSRHVQSNVFSHVLRDVELLDEAASWSYCAAYLKEQTLSVAQFEHARDQLARFFDDASPSGMTAN